MYSFIQFGLTIFLKFGHLMGAALLQRLHKFSETVGQRYSVEKVFLKFRKIHWKTPTMTPLCKLAGLPNANWLA